MSSQLESALIEVLHAFASILTSIAAVIRIPSDWCRAMVDLPPVDRPDLRMVNGEWIRK
jgi:hypothetical protein